MRKEKQSPPKPLKVVKYTNGNHPNSLANLKPHQYTKGISGNQGSGKGYSLTAALKHALYSKNKKEAKALIEATIAGAINLEPTPFKEVWDRVEGKVIDRTDHTFNGEGLSEVLSKLRGYQQLEEGK